MIDQFYLDVEQLIRRAQTDDSKAQFELACYYMVNPKEADFNTVCELLNKAAKSGHEEATAMLQGVADEFNKEESWAIKSYFIHVVRRALAGDAESQYYLGMYYRDAPHKSDKTRRKAFKWMQIAAQSGHAEAQLALAQMLFWDRYGCEDEDLALDWLHKSVNNGSTRAMLYLSDLYINGHFVTRDYEEAIRLVLLAVDAGDFMAYYQMANFYQQGQCGFDIDIDESIKWYKKAAELGDGYAEEQVRNMTSAERINTTDALEEPPFDAVPNLVLDDLEAVKRSLFLAYKDGDKDAEALLERVERHELSRAKLAFHHIGWDGRDNRVADFQVFEGSPVSPSREIGKTLQMTVAGVLYNAYAYCTSIVEGHTCYEPTNEHDADAIALIADNGRRIGYIPRLKQDLYETTFFGDNVRFVAFLRRNHTHLLLFTKDSRKTIWTLYKTYLNKYLNDLQPYELKCYKDYIEDQKKENRKRNNCKTKCPTN